MKNISFVIFFISIFIEAMYVFCNSSEQVSIDANTHIQMALSSIAHGEYFYPNKHWIYYLYSSTPGWINHIILCLSLGLGIKSVLYLNVLFNTGIGVLLYKITKKIFSNKIAHISLIIFSLYPTWIISPRIANSEIPYLFYMMLGVWFLLKNKWYFFFSAGICFAMANWIRPFLPILLLFGIIILYLRFKKKWYPYLYFMSGTVISILTIGIITYNHIGHFEYQSVTQGINMLMCAWDGTTGDFTTQICEKGYSGYIENMNSVPYWEKNAYWTHQAITWILQNPIKWLSFIPHRIITLFGSDTFYFVSYDNNCHIETIPNHFPKLSVYEWLFIINHIYYYIILATAFVGTILGLKKKNTIIIIIFLFLLASTGATVLAPGINRYHMVMMPFIIMLSAYFINLKIYHHDS